MKSANFSSWKYWLHVVIIAVVILGFLQLWKGGAMFTWYTILISVPLLAGGDWLAHRFTGAD